MPKVDMFGAGKTRGGGVGHFWSAHFSAKKKNQKTNWKTVNLHLDTMQVLEIWVAPWFGYFTSQTAS